MRQPYRPRGDRADDGRRYRDAGRVPPRRSLGGRPMSMSNQGRPTGVGTSDFTSVSGSSLLPNEPLLFEIGDREHSGVDLPDVKIDGAFLGGFERKSEIDLAGLTEPETLRHYVRLSRLNYR